MRRKRSQRCGSISSPAGSLKAALRTMGRDCGVPRPPLQAPDAEDVPRARSRTRADAARRAARVLEPVFFRPHAASFPRVPQYPWHGTIRCRPRAGGDP